jgi:phage tail protein X
LTTDTTYLTSQGDTLDFVCWKFYGQQSGAVESVLAANAGLADLGPVLPINTRITLPALTKPAQEVQPIRLWS